MRNKMTVVALAVVVAAAFAALSGVLLPSGTAVYAQVPENTRAYLHNGHQHHPERA